jgi:D-inositol-3-phosphate glycosyltransferase
MLSVHTCPLAALGGKETGGMNVYVREVSRELGRLGVDVDVFTRSQDARIPRVVQMTDHVRVFHVPAGPEAPLARERVHEHLDEFVRGVERWRLARHRVYHVIHAHYWLSGVAGLELRGRWSVPLVQMFHTLGRLKNEASRGIEDREPDVRVDEEARIAAAADRVIVASDVERARLIRDYDSADARVAVIPCGVDTELFAPCDPTEARTALGLGGGPLLLYVGRLEPIKGLDTLLGAVARLQARGRGVRLLVVGGEADERADGHQAHLRRRVAALGLADAVRFVGPQPQPDLRVYYNAADITVLPSHYESFGMVAMEAMACGRPVVASRVGGLTAAVVDGVTGLLVAEGDVALLAERIERLLDDADLRARLGLEGVRWAERHRWRCIAESVCREYAALHPRAQPHLSAARCAP